MRGCVIVQQNFQAGVSKGLSGLNYIKLGGYRLPVQVYVVDLQRLRGKENWVENR